MCEKEDHSYNHWEIYQAILDCPMKADVHSDILKRKGGACDDDFLEINQRLFESLGGYGGEI